MTTTAHRWRTLPVRPQVAALCLGLAALAGTAQAQPQPAQPLGTPPVAQVPSGQQPEEPPPAKPAGTHFMLEGAAGLSLSRSLGYGGHALFGAGGRVPSTPLRLYFLTGLAASRFHREGSGAERLRFDLFGGVGLRAYLPVVAGLRVYGDVMGGAQRAADTLSPAQGRALHRTEVLPELRVGLGFQVRPQRTLSLGAGVLYRAFDDSFEEGSRASGLSPLAPWSGHVSLALHF